MSDHPEHVSIERRMSGLAIASLVLGCLSVIAGPFGFLPGIVCGHLARRSIRKNPDQNGKGIALAGLIIGYLFMAITLVCLVLVISARIIPGSNLQKEVKGISTLQRSPNIGDGKGDITDFGILGKQTESEAFD